MKNQICFPHQGTEMGTWQKKGAEKYWVTRNQKGAGVS